MGGWAGFLIGLRNIIVDVETSPIIFLNFVFYTCNSINYYSLEGKISICLIFLRLFLLREAITY